MLPVEDWLCDHNLPRTLVDRLEGEALTYALIAYILHPVGVPDEVTIILAEGVFGKLFNSNEEN